MTVLVPSWVDSIFPVDLVSGDILWNSPHAIHAISGAVLSTKVEKGSVPFVGANLPQVSRVRAAALTARPNDRENFERND